MHSFTLFSEAAFHELAQKILIKNGSTDENFENVPGKV
jgi:hypothetical protein